MYVFVEGETEASYLNRVKSLQRGYVVRVRLGQTPEELVALAVEQRQISDRLARELGTPKAEWPVVWCLFDRDSHPGIPESMRRAERHGVRVGFSHPCFELWLLLHFEDFGAPCGGDCQKVIRRLGKHLGQYRKGMVDLSALATLSPIATARAAKLSERHVRDGISGPDDCDPSTRVHELLADLDVRY
jgi:hypothetical protein